MKFETHNKIMRILIAIIVIIYGTVFILLFLSLSSCNFPERQSAPEKQYVEVGKDFEIHVIDSCEYIVLERFYRNFAIGGITHKPNCRFCAERRNLQSTNPLPPLNKGGRGDSLQLQINEVQ